MSASLREFSEGLAQAVAAAAPGIVCVKGRRRTPASGVVWAAEGLIVTAHHVVERHKKLQVAVGDGEMVAATLVGRDPATDLAVLRSAAGDLTPLARADSEPPLQVGHLVLALARPGQQVQATVGIISALTGQWRTPVGGKIDRYLQTDVLMYPGFSGGPLVNTAGQMVGINSSALRRGASITVPLATVTRVVESLLTHGRIRRGYLGVSTQPVRIPPALKEEIQQETGLLLVGVEPGSPAEAGGLLLGDTIVAVEDTAVRHHDHLRAALAADKVGQKVPFRIIRGGQIQEIAVKIGEQK